MHDLTPEERATLPTLPEDGDRVHTWKVISAEGPLVLPLQEGQTEALEIDVTPEWIADRVSDYTELTKPGYYEAGHTREHNRNGLRELGDVCCLSSWVDPRDKRTKLLAGIRWPKGMDPREAIDSGVLRYGSPSWGSYVDEAGKTWPFALLETSAVLGPHQKGMAPRHYLSESIQCGETDNAAVSPETNTGEDTMPDVVVDEMPDEETGPTLASLGERFALMEEGMAKVMERIGLMEDCDKALDAEMAEDKQERNGGDEEEEQGKNGGKLAELEAELAEKTLELRKMKFCEDARAKVLGTAPQEVALAAFELSETNGAAYDLLVGHLGKPVPVNKLGQAAKDFQFHLGESGGAPKVKGPSLSRKECFEKAGADSAEYKKLLAENGLKLN